MNLHYFIILPVLFCSIVEIFLRIMAAINQVNTLSAELQKEWAKPVKNLKRCGELLEQLKVSYRVVTCRKYCR